jgi:uncharacterized protein (AIM24 family)
LLNSTSYSGYAFHPDFAGGRKNGTLTVRYYQILFTTENQELSLLLGRLEMKLSGAGNYKSLFFSGEGLVCRFRGQGKAWIQTRKVPAWISWVNPFRPSKNN